MISSLLSSNPAANLDRSSSRRKKRKKMHNQPQNQSEFNADGNPQIWKSDARQQIYSAKLRRALQQVRQSGGPLGSASRRVHEAANRVLAATARGRSRWSRAVLTSRLKVKFAKRNSVEKRQRKVMTVISGGGEIRAGQRKSKVSVSRLRSKGLPAFQRKASILGRLVPGCRKEALPVVLEEAADYIAALEMQVRAMSALAELLSVSGPSDSGFDMAPANGLHQLGPSRSSPS